MEPVLAADDPLNHHASEVDEEYVMDSETRDEEIAAFLREYRLQSIDLHKHQHKLKTLSVIPESILQDSEISSPISDLGLPASMESVGPDPDLEVSAPMEASESLVPDPDLGLSAPGEAPGYEARMRAYAEELRALKMDYDETKEFTPWTEFMMRSLLPRYFDLVRSFLSLV